MIFGVSLVDRIASRFRKKYTLTLLLFAAGTAIAWETGATIEAYGGFALILLGTFGVQDLVDKGKIRQVSSQVEKQ